MEYRKLPAQDLLLKLLAYDAKTGRLTWLERTPELFTDGKRTASAKCAAWNSVWAGKEAFTHANHNGYRVGSVGRVTYMAHRIIWMMIYGREPRQIDHIDGDPRNNRVDNLRDVESYENQRNQGLATINSSGEIGVCWCPSLNRWKAQIANRDGTIHLGIYEKFNEAVIARRAAERALGYHENHGRRPNRKSLIEQSPNL